MPSICQFPLCKFPEERGGFCLHHAKHFAGAKPEVSKKPIKKVSDKRKEENKTYKKQVKSAVKKDPRCKIKSPVCTGKAQGLHHLQKRSPKNLTNPKNQVSACNACNLYIEENPIWARNNGFTISRFKKTTA